MKRLALVGAIALLGSGSVGAKAFVSAGPVVRLTRTAHGTDYSRNWAGYDAIGASGDYTHVAASWTQPSVTCGGTNSYSSFWVGLDGGVPGNRTVEQTGTEADCINGVPTYSAWYEVFPKAAHTCSLVTINDTDSITASVDYDSTSGMFTLAVTDNTNSDTCGTTFALRRAQLSTAEVIAEAPSGSHSPVFGILPLANFGTVSFTGAQVTISPATTPVDLSAASPDEVIMTTDGTSGGTVKADPGSLSDGSFDVTWDHA